MNNTNKKIVSNTILLNLRMIVTIVVGLYTSRVVLLTLGASDFGIYTLVGGIVTMTGFLNTAMTQASQRFMSYALGQKDKAGIHLTFSTSIFTHLLIAAAVLLLAETVGLYIVQQLIIPDDRIVAANWVYQCSIATFIVSILSVPYNSCIIAHERMNVYAYTNILEVLLKLAILYLLVWSPCDKLISYALLFLLVQLIVRLIYSVYCRRHFEECRLRPVFNKAKLKEMFGFAGWSILGNFGFSMRDQGVSIILNLFLGTIANAARGIAISVSTIINGFANNITMAINPQITKQYAAGNIQESINLVYMGSRIAFSIMMLITIPFIVHMDYILTLWLGQVPDNTVLFLYFILAVSLLYSLSQPVTVALQATGDIKNFQIWICCLMLLELVLTYLILYLTGNLIYALCPSILTNSIALLVRFYLLHQLVPQYRWSDYMLRVVARCIGLYAVCFIVIYAVHTYCVGDDSLKTFLISFPLEILSILLMISLVGLNKRERNYIINKIPFLPHRS